MAGQGSDGDRVDQEAFDRALASITASPEGAAGEDGPRRDIGPRSEPSETEGPRRDIGPRSEPSETEGPRRDIGPRSEPFETEGPRRDIGPRSGS